jgi:hypothetical protein
MVAQTMQLITLTLIDDPHLNASRLTMIFPGQTLNLVSGCQTGRMA